MSSALVLLTARWANPKTAPRITSGICCRLMCAYMWTHYDQWASNTTTLVAIACLLVHSLTQISLCCLIVNHYSGI